MKEEFDLGDELRKLSYPYQIEVLLREFIRLLKDDDGRFLTWEDYKERIDKLAGDKLK